MMVREWGQYNMKEGQCYITWKDYFPKFTRKQYEIGLRIMR